MPIPISEIEANPPWLQYGAFGLVCLIVIWFIKVIIPQYIMAMKAVSENFTAELREQRLAHAKERFEDRSDFKKFMSDQFALLVESKHDQATAIEHNTNATQELTKAFRAGCVNAKV